MNFDEWFQKAILYFNGEMTTEDAQLFLKETEASEQFSELIRLWKNTDLEAEVYEKYRTDTEKFIATHQRLKGSFTNDNSSGKLAGPIFKWIAVAAVATGIFFLVKMIIPSSEKNITVAQHKMNKEKYKTSTSIDSIENSISAAKKKEGHTDSLLQEPVNTGTLFAQAFAPDEVPENPNGPLDDAFFYYSSGQYRKAIAAIENAHNKALTRGNNNFSPVLNFYIVYYKALSLMSLGNVSEAIPLLKNSVTLSPSRSLKAKADWYLALAYLKVGNIPDAIAELKSLKDNPSAVFYKAKADQLLGSLNK